MGSKKVRRANSLFIALLRNSLGKAIKAYFNVKYEDKSIMGLKPPFIILGNHTNNLDPFFIAVRVKAPVHFVASDEYFRNPTLRFLLNLVGAIPKVKLTTDVSSVNNIINLIKTKRVIGIFPEGSRNWDGNTLGILLPTAKLIKRLKVPVVAAVSSGAYMSWPRWAKTIRRGQVNIKFKVILNEKDIEDKSRNEIYSILKDSLEHNEYKNQREFMQPFRGNALAEYLELFLYVCPECLSIGNLKSEDDKLYCEKCGHTVTYDKYGFLKGEGKTYFDNPSDWGKWQTDWFKGKIENQFHDINKLEDAIITDEVLIKVGGKASPLKDLDYGTIELNLQEIKFKGQKNKEIAFNIKKIRGINVQYNNLFEFYYENILYRFIFKTKYVSAYKWVEAVELIKSMR
jgi:1-acyl-sn-glycerol-3-phosphate acyltransferase